MVFSSWGISEFPDKAKVILQQPLTNANANYLKTENTLKIPIPRMGKRRAVFGADFMGFKNAQQRLSTPIDPKLLNANYLKTNNKIKETVPKSYSVKYAIRKLKKEGAAAGEPAKSRSPIERATLIRDAFPRDSQPYTEWAKIVIVLGQLSDIKTKRPLKPDELDSEKSIMEQIDAAENEAGNIDEQNSGSSGSGLSYASILSDRSDEQDEVDEYGRVIWDGPPLYEDEQDEPDEGDEKYEAEVKIHVPQFIELPYKNKRGRDISMNDVRAIFLGQGIRIKDDNNRRPKKDLIDDYIRDAERAGFIVNRV